MSDEQPFYAPDRKPAAPREPRPGELLWTLVKGTESRRAELRDHGVVGTELQIFAYGQFVKGQRYENRTLAMLPRRDPARAVGDGLDVTDFAPVCSDNGDDLDGCLRLESENRSVASSILALATS